MRKCCWNSNGFDKKEIRCRENNKTLITYKMTRLELIHRLLTSTTVSLPMGASNVCGCGLIKYNFLLIVDIYNILL